jgi:hypothetical protein
MNKSQIVYLLYGILGLLNHVMQYLLLLFKTGWENQSQEASVIAPDLGLPCWAR